MDTAQLRAEVLPGPNGTHQQFSDLCPDYGDPSGHVKDSTGAQGVRASAAYFNRKLIKI